jgi:hypothetical protein
MGKAQGLGAGETRWQSAAKPLFHCRGLRLGTQIARRTILSDDALSVLVPVLEEIVGWNAAQVRALFEGHGFMLREWDKVRTDSITIGRATNPAPVGGIS